jgi:hypothetical protein
MKRRFNGICRSTASNTFFCRANLLHFPVGKFRSLKHRQRNHLGAIANQYRSLFFVALQRQLNAVLHIEAIDLLHRVITLTGFRHSRRQQVYETLRLRPTRLWQIQPQLSLRVPSISDIGFVFRHRKIIGSQQIHDAADGLEGLILLCSNLGGMFGKIRRNSSRLELHRLRLWLPSRVSWAGSLFAW